MWPEGRRRSGHNYNTSPQILTIQFCYNLPSYPWLFIFILIYILICWLDFIDIRFSVYTIFPFSLISKTVIRNLKIIKRFPPDLERSYSFILLFCVRYDRIPQRIPNSFTNTKQCYIFHTCPYCTEWLSRSNIFTPAQINISNKIIKTLTQWPL